MPLDPAVKKYLEEYADPAGLDLPDRTAEENRRLAFESAKSLPTPQPVEKIEDRTIDGPHGPIPIRIYTPEGPEPKGIFVYFHGGGWVLGSIEQDLQLCCELANASGAIVIAVEYRLAPEYRFPIPFDDCYAATRWAVENAVSLGGDPARVAIGGNSAGGNLAAAVAIAARDRGEFSLAFQVPTYPITNDNFNTPSYLENGEGYGLTREGMRWFWKLYLAREEDARSPYVSPLRCEDLTGLPPALIITAQYDVLRDEGEEYAHRLKEAAVPVTLTRYDGIFHGFFKYTHLFKQSRQAMRQVADALKEVFA